MKKYLIVAGILAASLVVHPSLRGSRGSMVAQNKAADRQHLSRITERQLPRFKKAGLLQQLRTGKVIKIDHRLAPKFRYARPRVKRFLVELGTAHYRKFHRALQVNSAVRTVEYQHHLMHHNRNAARGTDHWSQSSHLTGATVDITKKGMSRAELKWMRTTLLRYEAKHRIEATEEKLQPVFHFMVLR